MKSPQTNGICERFHKTILQEFYQITFRKKLYESIEALQIDLDEWLEHYNTQRTHQGKMCCGRTPFETMIPSQRCKHRLPGNEGQRNLEGKVRELNLTRQMPPEKR